MAAHAVQGSVSGQVNRAIMVGDDGQGSDILHVDGDASGSRFRFTGSDSIGQGLTAGVNLEIEVQSNDSFAVQLKQTSDIGTTLGIRHADVYFSGNFGKLSMGQSSDALDGVAFADLNGAWIPVENASDFGGSIAFRTSAGGTVGGITTGDVTPSYDGGRRDRVRYDSPSIGPLSFAVSHATDSQIDASGSLAGSVMGGAYDLRVGWRNSNRGQTPSSANSGETILVSGAFKFAQGTSIQGAWGELSEIGGTGTPDGSYYYIKVGHDWGNNSVAADYKASEDTVLSGSCSGGTLAAPACGGTSFGLGAVHTIPSAGVDIYAGYRFFSLEDTAPGVSADDVSVFFVGSRIKFN
jgi:predicted porin